MSDIITLTGIVATPPRHLVTSAGLAITSFRLASRQRRFDRTRNTWVDADTNWYTISAFRQLAHNTRHSVRKGEHVLVTGRLRIRDWENADRNGTSIEVEADAVGHDLSWCTTSFVRSAPASSRESEPVDPEETRASSNFTQSEMEQAVNQADGLENASDGFLPTEALSLATIDS